MPVVSCLILGTSLWLSTGALTGCARKERMAGASAGVTAPAVDLVDASGTRISIDGSMNDWPANRSSLADEDFYYFRIGIGEPDMTLQASPESLTLLVDADGNAKTGLTRSEPDSATSFGADIMVQFSPPGKDGTEAGRGVKVYQITKTGGKRELPRTQATVVFGPTYANPWFEIRLGRGMFTQAGTGRVMYVLENLDGKVIGWSDPESFSAPAGRANPATIDAEVPERPEDAIRIVSYNVLQAGTMKNPAPYARILSLLQPDAVVVQEWNDTPAGQIESWFNATVSTGGTPWHARTSEGRGVAIVSQYPIEALAPDKIELNGDGNPNAVRFVGGLVKTPIGDLALGSVHLKSRGSKGSPEDVRRMNEANAIAGAMRAALEPMSASVPMRLIAGDMNLVGSRPPLDALRAGLDVDGSELAVAEPRVLGDGSAYTWADPKTEFSPGRLDYAIFSDATCEVVNAFLLDTTRLSDATLARLGLDRGDSTVSDHLPMVIDLRLKSGVASGQRAMPAPQPQRPATDSQEINLQDALK